jgi:hypothetical protein
MTAKPRGWWTDEPAAESFATNDSPAKESPTSGGPANGNPIIGDSQRPGAAPTADDAALAGAVADRAAAAAANPSAADGKPEGETGDETHPGRLALGMAVLVADRIRPGGAASNAFVTGVGLVAQTAAEAESLARRAMGPPARAAAIAAAVAAILPGADLPRRSLARSRAMLRRVAGEARRRGETAVAAGRADATAFLQANVADGIAWAQARAVPQIVDGLVPHLVDRVVPRLIDGAIPEIRSRVLPIVIEDLTKDPRVRDLVVEQGRGAVGETAQQLRATTATADDRVESAFRRLVPPGPCRSPTTAEEPLGTETSPQPGHG